MFSNNENIETISQLVEVLRHYVSLQSEYQKLNVTEKIVRLLTVITMTLVLSFFVVLVLIYASFAIAFALEPLLGLPLAFTAVAAAYIIVLLLFVTFRKRWIEKPLVRFLASILMEK
jgi:hypothetical protein